MGTGATGKGGGGATTGNGGSSGSLTGVMLVPDDTGWIDAAAVGNTVGVQGAWYPYGDAYGEAKCVAGGHTMAECSMITMPNPTGMGFPNTAGSMCTAGTAAKVLDIPGMTGTPDYSNMWGAGIGLDLKASGGDNSTKSPWSATADGGGVTGISFKIDSPPLAGMRVEFPQPSTEGSSAGSDYWGATSGYAASPVVAGTNVIHFTATDVLGPGPTSHVFDPTQILSIQFHVPASTSAAGPYSFCISELTFLK